MTSADCSTSNNNNNNSSSSSNASIRLLCPLCQEPFQVRCSLEQHLCDVHHVSRDAIQRLMSIVDLNDNQPSPPDAQKENEQGNSNLASSSSNTNNISLDSNSALLSAATATAAAAAAAAAASNSTSDLNSSTLDSFSKSASAGDSINTSIIGTSGSDKLIYKHRCTQCPLAFKTAEKLTLHSQYHTIRQASQCILCAKSFRSIEALQKHVESSHQDMSPAELDALRVSLAANPFLNNRNESGGILDPSTTRLLRAESKQSLNGSALTSENTSDAEQDDESSPLDTSAVESDLLNDSTNQTEQDESIALATTEDEPLVESHTAQLEDLLNSQALAESNYSDPARKFKCHRCKVAFTRQSYLTAHNKTLWHRKGEKLTYPMEKYLDPNRPFKCEICKESFTQKNILLVHYNSVSHLHKLKQLIKDGGSLPASADEDLKASLESNQAQSCEDESAINNVSTSNNQNSENSNTESAKSLLNELQLLQQQQLLLNAVQANLNQSGNNPSSISNLNCVQCGVQLPNADSLAQHQQICQLLAASKLTEAASNQTTSSSATVTTAVNSSSATESAASALASSKFYSATHASSRSKPPVYKHLLETWGYEIVQQFNEHHQRRKRPRVEQESDSTGDQEMENVEQTISDSAPIDESETPIESSADNQSQPSADSNDPIESLETKSTDQTNIVAEQDSDEKKENNPNSNNNLTESDRCRCETCDKEFSSIWVLKAHQEEVHKDIVKMQTIQDFAEIYRKEFERKNVLVVKSVLIDGPEADSAQSASTNQDTQTASSGALVMNGSANDTTTADASNSQTNAINANENEANNQNAQMNALLGSNPLLCQAFAALMQQQQQPLSNNSNNAQTNSNGNNNNQQQMDMANQMAQLQMNQLLMSMGLAGAMGGNQPNTQQAAALAALGIPPQMLPLMMAGAVQDPMMALFNPMIAAMATNNPLAGAAGLLGMNAETMLAAGLMPAAMAAQAAASAPSPATANQLISSKTPVPIASPSLSTSLSTTPAPNASASAAAAAAAAAANAASLAQSGKRARTRITDDQLKILRQYFDINNSPTEEALQEMAVKSQLPLKVIKHWFRNTLFKERQRNKDSPYNFNNPPSTFLNLEEYEKTGEAKITPLDENKSENATASSSGIASTALNSSTSSNQGTGRISTEPIKNETKMDYDFNSSDDDKSVKKEDSNKSDAVLNSNASSVATANSTNQLQQFLAAMAQQQQQIQQLQQQQLQQSVLNSSFTNGDGDASCKSYTMSPRSDDSMDSINTDASNANLSASGNGGPNMQIYSGMQFANLPGMPPLQNSLQMALQSPSLASGQQLSLLGSSGGALSAPTTPLSGSGSTGATSAGSNSAGSASNPGKRANRTRFTDYQIKVLQEFFETNAYPKDDDLEYLSKLLGLSPRVIVVWFQNARQKARKVYENQPAEGMLGTTPPAQGTPGTTTPGNGNSSSNQRNAALHYQCKKCQQVFQRYYELIKHQKSSCFKDENPLAAQIKAAQEARSVETQLQSNSVSNDSTSNTPSNSAQLSATSPSGAISASTTSAAVQNGTFQCDKCSLSFNRLDMFREHQLLHLMNPALFASLNDSINSQPTQSTPSLQQQPPTSSPALSCKSPSSTPLFDLANGGSPASVQQQQQQLLLQQQLLQLQQLQQQAQQNSLSTPTSGSMKRKIDDDDDCDSQSGGDGSQCSGNGTRSSSARDKRLRTAILPEQLDYLYQKYQLESNPSRKMLESISEEVGLKKRVVQVWFQNTRARERKGQLRAHQQVIHKRCPFCRALFKARSALESHLATRHADQYTKGEIDIDALPDSDSGDEGQYPLNSNSASQQNLLALAGLGLAAAATGNSNNVIDESNQLSNALSSLLAAGGPFAGLGVNENISDSQSLNTSGPDALTAQLRKYIEGLTNPNALDLAALNGLTGALNNNIEPLSVKKDQQSNGLPRAETPLDLTKPIDLS